MRLLACCSAALLLACENPAATPEPAPDPAGHYEGTWRFVLRDSAWLENPFGCGFAPCGPTPRRPYVTITCAAILDVQVTDAQVHVYGNTTAPGWSGQVTLSDCAEAYATEEERFLSAAPPVPTGLVTVAAVTRVTGMYSVDETLGIALRLLNSTESYGEMLGCAPGQNNPRWHFGARLCELNGASVLRGGVADGYLERSFNCGAYELFLESSFRMERVSEGDID